MLCHIVISPEGTELSDGTAMRVGCEDTRAGKLLPALVSNPCPDPSPDPDICPCPGNKLLAFVPVAV